MKPFGVVWAEQGRYGLICLMTMTDRRVGADYRQDHAEGEYVGRFVIRDVVVLGGGR